MANTRLQRTFSQAATSTKKGTFSFWMKRGSISGEQDILASPYGSGRSFIRFESSGQMYATINNASDDSITNRLFKDTSAWYHIVLAIDLTQSTSTDRLKFYVNGDLVTSYSSQNPPSSSETISWGQNGKITDIGYDTTDGGAGYFDGALSHIHWIDGTAYDASYFGETDATTGEWKIKTSPSVTYGNNGFFILKDGNTITDSSPNSNNFGLAGGTLTKTEDCPDNVFATWNPLIKQYSGDIILANGNTKLQNSNGWSSMFTTIGAETGKYYWEIKINDISATTLSFIGVVGGGYVTDGNRLLNDSTPYDNTDGMLLWQNGGQTIINDDSTNAGTYASYAAGDILGFALDLTSATKTIQFYKNGTIDSTGSINLPTNMQTDFVFPHAQVNNNIVFANFGNGYFGTTAVSSAGTNASGNGIFEYNVPAGFTALSTKGLNL